jgi:tetratricopeptide (TPR) repeat protein
VAARHRCYLPYDTSDFAGRTDELGWLAHARPGVVTLAALDGMAGIGKTTLAIRAAHRLADRFPDGQLFVDLHGHTAGQAPMGAGTALDILLRQLGVPGERIPVSVTDRSALWRAELAGRRVLAVLDNAVGTDHVRPLLPGASSSLVLITSRRRLTDLDGAQTLSVDLLPPADAVAMFTRIVGARAEAEPVAVLDVLQLCGFLPLAVRIAAARLRHRPRWTVAYLADRLRDQRRRLAELATSERGVAAAFNLSYGQLDPARQRMFRLLGLHPGRDIDANAAAALADLPPETAEDLLEDLLDAHVLRQHEPARYTFHDLLREHARTTALATEAPDEQQAALARLSEHYMHEARLAVDVLFDYSRNRPSHVPAPNRPILSFSGEAEATAWLDAERANLLAVGAHTAEHGPPITGDLATALRPYLDARGHPSDALTLHTHALTASRLLGDKTSEATALVDLGWLSYRLGDHDEALTHSRRALELALESSDLYTASRALNTIGNVHLRKREHSRAHEHLERALALSNQIGNRVGEAHVLGNLAISYQRQGLYDQASDHHRQALDLHRQVGNRGGEARAMDHLGVVYRSQGRHEQARDHHQQALDLYRLLGNRNEQASALNGLGEVARAMDQPDQAVVNHEAALAFALEQGNRPEQARAEHGLAHAHRDLGRPDTARAHAERALDLYTGIGVPEADEMRALLGELG